MGSCDWAGQGCGRVAGCGSPEVAGSRWSVGCGNCTCTSSGTAGGKGMVVWTDAAYGCVSGCLRRWSEVAGEATIRSGAGTEPSTAAAGACSRGWQRVRQACQAVPTRPPLLTSG